MGYEQNYMENSKDLKKIKPDDLTINKIKSVLEQIRPSLQMDGGDVHFVDFDRSAGLLKIELMGHCAHCPMSGITLKQGIETEIKQAVPDVKEVQAVET